MNLPSSPRARAAGTVSTPAAAASTEAGSALGMK
jgi:hypothetical protein